MVIFWIIVAVLTAIALAFVILPLNGVGRASRPRQFEVNREIYQAKLAELEQDRVNDLISQADFTAARDELSRELLTDLTDDSTNEVASGQAGSRLVWAVAILIPLLAIGIYSQLSSGLQYVDGDHPVANEGPPPTVEEMIELLAARLEQNTDDIEGWTMLGRSLMITQRYNEATRAYMEANKLAESPQIDLKVALAEAMVYANNGQFNARTSSLVTEALALDDKHQKALWLAGLGAFQQGRYSQAINHWQLLKTLLPQDNDDLISALSKQIARARQAESGQDLSQSSGVNEDPAADENAIPASIRVNVELSPEFTDLVQPDDTVFVYATAVSGPPIPLALVRRKVEDLPLQVQLDDSTAMLPEMNLSTQSRVKIQARVSRTGQAQPGPGDFTGVSKPVASSTTEAVDIFIDAQIPE